jgi:hypothetical protein
VHTYHYVLYVHLLSLFVGIGAGAVLLACLLQLRVARTLEDAVQWGAMAGKVGKFFPVTILGLFGSGAYMTSNLCGTARRRRPADGAQARGALRANGPGPLGPEARRMTLHPGLSVVEFSHLGLVFGIVWNMTEKPRLGGALAAALGGYAVGAVLALLVTRRVERGARPGSRRRGVEAQADRRVFSITRA